MIWGQSHFWGICARLDHTGSTIGHSLSNTLLNNLWNIYWISWQFWSIPISGPRQIIQWSSLRRRCPRSGFQRWGRTSTCGSRRETRWYRLIPPNCHFNAKNIFMNYRRKFRSQNSDNVDRWKSRGGKSQRGEESREDQRRVRVRRKKKQVFFPIVAEVRKVGSLKRRVRRHVVRWGMKSCTPLWREAHFQVKMHKTHQRRMTFRSWDVEKAHAVAARSTFPSQNIQNTPFSNHFWKLRCRKSVRRCGTKHISKSKYTKHTWLGPLLEVEMSKKCTPLWREAHFEVKMFKTKCSDHFWRFRCGFAWQAQRILHLAKSEKNVKVLKQFQLQPLHYNTTTTTTTTTTTLHYTTLRYTTLITLHSTKLHYIQLRHITLH